LRTFAPELASVPALLSPLEAGALITLLLVIELVEAGVVPESNALFVLLLIVELLELLG